jgi:predicted nucleotidyltransferase component of viral defense system
MPPAARIKRRHLTKEDQRVIANTLHWAVISEMMKVSEWGCEDIAFQGGTSLHLVWKSPRFSDDLDFLLNDQHVSGLGKIMEKVRKKIQEHFALHWPGCTIDVADKRKDTARLAWFQFSFSDEDKFFEKVHTKVEFWPVNKHLLKAYGHNLQHASSGNQMLAHIMTLAIPAADREWIYHDKIHAIADRGFVKWRDIFDLWWLRTQSESENGKGLPQPDHSPEFMVKSNVVNAMYNSTAPNMIPGLKKFMEENPEDVLLKKAENEMFKYLPDNMWNAMWPDQFKHIISFVRKEIEHTLFLLENPDYVGRVKKTLKKETRSESSSLSTKAKTLAEKKAAKKTIMKASPVPA